jgi:trimethylamine:corrinoid methyltransferase-like protein
LPLWSSSDLEEILRDALHILEEIGVECTHQEVRRRLAEHAGAQVFGDRVYLAGDRVRVFLDERRISVPASTW